jgi:hypothetical protein
LEEVRNNLLMWYMHSLPLLGVLLPQRRRPWLNEKPFQVDLGGLIFEQLLHELLFRAVLRSWTSSEAKLRVPSCELRTDQPLDVAQCLTRDLPQKIGKGLPST